MIEFYEIFLKIQWNSYMHLYIAFCKNWFCLYSLPHHILMEYSNDINTHWVLHTIKKVSSLIHYYLNSYCNRKKKTK